MILCFHIDLCTLDWVALSTIATAVMAIITGLTLRQNKEQLNELKRQWIENNRPHLVFTFVCVDSWWCLKIDNIGNSIANKIDISLSKNFIDKIGFPTAKVLIERVNRPFPLDSHTSKYFFINPVYSNDGVLHNCEMDHIIITEEQSNKFLEDIKKEKLVIRGNYDGYSVDTELDLEYYMISGMRVNSELYKKLDSIEKGLIVKNKDYMPIQKSLDIIAKSMDNN